MSDDSVKYAVHYRNITLSMVAGFCVWVIASVGYAISITTSAEHWKTQIEDKIDLLVRQTVLLPDHEHRLLVLETQLPAIKQGLDKVDQKLDVVIEKLGNHSP